MQILIVEDDHLLRKALGYWLLDAGHTVSLATNGREAFDLVEKNRHLDLIICDILMPELSGPTFILKLKKFYPEKRPAIIIITSVKEGSDFLNKLEIDYDHFMAKPVDFDRLDAIIAGMEK